MSYFKTIDPDHSLTSNNSNANTGYHKTKNKGVSPHHVVGYLESREVLDVLVLRVDDLAQLPAVHHLLKNVHLDRVVKLVKVLDVVTNDPGNCGAPETHTHKHKKEQKDPHKLHKLLTIPELTS